MSTIRLNAEGLQHSSQSLKGQGNELEGLIRNMEGIINGLQDHWEGEAARAYAEQFHNLKPGLVQTRQLIEQIATQIDQTLQAAQELDSSIASKLR